jgi:hypothetical protein
LLARTARPFAEMTLLCAFVVWANRRAARALQRKIDALGE